jgi:CBS domain-containing protein/predicted RNA-binding Zn-ribbon protein involved in translation (DUF1610 family)
LEKVRDVMTTKVLKVNPSDTVLDACIMMNREKSSGAVVFQGDQPMGLLTDRTLLRFFVPLNHRPDEVKVQEVMVPFLKVSADASMKDAAKIIIDNGITRLGVFDDGKFVGYVTLADIVREAASKTSPLDALHRYDESEREVLCPHCGKGVLEKIWNREGEVTAWRCPNCGYAL